MKGRVPLRYLFTNFKDRVWHHMRWTWSARRASEEWAKKTPKAFKGKHPDWYWVEVEIPLTKKEMVDFFGEPCASFSKSCVLCQAWRQWRKNGRATVTVERTQLLK
jgi:hypothetical protein